MTTASVSSWLFLHASNSEEKPEVCGFCDCEGGDETSLGLTQLGKGWRGQGEDGLCPAGLWDRGKGKEAKDTQEFPELFSLLGDSRAALFWDSHIV